MRSGTAEDEESGCDVQNADLAPDDFTLSGPDGSRHVGKPRRAVDAQPISGLQNFRSSRGPVGADTVPWSTILGHQRSWQTMWSFYGCGTRLGLGGVGCG